MLTNIRTTAIDAVMRMVPTTTTRQGRRTRKHADLITAVAVTVIVRA